MALLYACAIFRNTVFLYNERVNIPGITVLWRHNMDPIMNEEEKRLLGSLIKEDDVLYPYQSEALCQLRGAISYMRAKYPTCDLEFRYFDPDVKTTEKGVLIVNLKDSPLLHKTLIRKTEDGYAYTDDLYGELIRETYDEALSKELSREGITVSVYTMFYSFVSEEVNEKTDVNAILKKHTGLRRHTDLFVKDEWNVNEGVKKALAAKGFYASYTVFEAPESHRISLNAKERYEGCRETASFMIRREGDAS